MSVQILGYKTITALPVDFQPELDAEGFPLDGSITRTYTPTQFPWATVDLAGGDVPDPLETGFLGDRWYQLGDCVGATFDMSSSRLSVYRDELLEMTGAATAQDSVFHDLIVFDSPDGLLGPASCARLAAAYAQHPYAYDQSQVHQEIAEMIQEIATHGGCLVFQG